MTYTAKQMEMAVYRFRHNCTAFPTMLPRIFVWSWESDVLYLSRDGYAQEFEIKRTRNDYCADKFKMYKHHVFRHAHAVGPSYFWYVCPPDLISEHEIPAYAGLCYVVERRPHYKGDSPLTLQVVSRAPRRACAPKLTDQQRASFMGKSVSRYWTLREQCSA